MSSTTRTPREIYELLGKEDREEVKSNAFSGGLFDESGQIMCACRPNTSHFSREKLSACDKIEYLCEEIAARILVPWDYPTLNDDQVAAIWDIEPWVVRFRRAMGDLPIVETEGPQLHFEMLISQEEARDQSALVQARHV